MKEWNKQALIELEKKLLKKIKILEDEIKKLPAYPRKKQDEKDREEFDTVCLFAMLMGITIFGSGWFVVAVSGTLLSLVIVESGLFLSMAMGFSGKPLYNTYLWLRDLLSSEKIKNQNQDFNQAHHQLLELQKLAANNSGVIKKINHQLNKALRSLPNKFFSEKNVAEFEQLSLKKQIQQLEQKKQRHPAYLRRKKDQQVSDKINEYWDYYMLGLNVIFLILVLMELVCPLSILLLIPFNLVLLFIPVSFAIAFGPIIVSNIVRETYLFIRNWFSPTAIKAENKQLVQLEKAIDKLIDLENQQQQIAETICSTLELSDVSMQSDKVKEVFSENSNDDSGKDKYQYGTFFSEVPANQSVKNTLLEIPGLTS